MVGLDRFRPSGSRAGRGRRAGWAALALPLALAACGSSGTGGAATPPPCVSPPPGEGPGATATLQNADNGHVICLHVGDVLTVFLRSQQVDVSQRWSPVSNSNTVALKQESIGVMTLARGITGAIYRASAPGLSQLASAHPPCSPDNASGCDADLRWSATVEVQP